MTIPVFIINLDRDFERFERAAKQLKEFEFLEPVRMAAFPGRTIPDHVCHILTGNEWSHEHKGTLGCFLSHFAIWEIVANSTEHALALAVEDNVKFLRCDILRNLALPEDADLVFCNARTAFHQDDADTDIPIFRDVFEVLPFVEEHGRSVGTDGYIVTKKGAKKLIQFVTKDRLFSHVDLRMLAYCLSPSDGRLPDSFTKSGKTILQFRRMFPEIHQLKAYSLFPPVTDRLYNLSSTRVIEDEAGKRKV